MRDTKPFDLNSHWLGFSTSRWLFSIKVLEIALKTTSSTASELTRVVIQVDPKNPFYCDERSFVGPIGYIPKQWRIIRFTIVFYGFAI
jgi:hypothetical protein